MKFRWRSRQELADFRDAQLRRLLVHAYENVPYYRTLFDRHRLHPRHVRGVIDLDLIPLSSKQDMRGLPPEKVIAAGHDPARLLTARTSGATGEPFVIRRSWLEDKRNHLFRLRALNSMGVRLGDRRVAVGVVRPSDPNHPKRIFRPLRGLGITGAPRLNGLEEPEIVAAKLRKLRPDVITGMPGILCRVADYLISSGSHPVHPRLVVVGGEVLTSVMQHRLSTAFQAPVYQTYASHEFPLLSWQCTRTQELHCCDDGVILEVLHEGRPAQPGEQGEVVVTNLNAFTMPFIRYRLGDIATVGAQQCACGAPFSTIRQVQGRSIDSFTLPDGRVIHPYQLLSSFIGGSDGWIRQYQLLQERRDRIVLRVIPNQPAVSDHISRIERSVLPVLGPGVEFKVQLLDHIPLEHTGKFRSARSLVEPGPSGSLASNHG